MFFHSSDGIMVKFQETAVLPEFWSSTAAWVSGLSLLTSLKVLNGVVRPMSEEMDSMPSLSVMTHFRKSLVAFLSASEALSLMHQ